MGNNALFISTATSFGLNPLASVFADRFGRKATFGVLTAVNALGALASLVALSYWPIVLGVSIQIASGCFYPRFGA